MTREEAINTLIAVGVCNTGYLDCDKHCPLYRCKNVGEICTAWDDKMVKEAVETIAALRTLDTQEKPKTPCDLCLYNPPSSGDRKPCTMCPASSLPEPPKEN